MCIRDSFYTVYKIESVYSSTYPSNYRFGTELTCNFQNGSTFQKFFQCSDEKDPSVDINSYIINDLPDHYLFSIKSQDNPFSKLWSVKKDNCHWFGV